MGTELLRETIFCTFAVQNRDRSNDDGGTHGDSERPARRSKDVDQEVCRALVVSLRLLHLGDLVFQELDVRGHSNLLLSRGWECLRADAEILRQEQQRYEKESQRKKRKAGPRQLR
jgi:hypothetical protein